MPEDNGKQNPNESYTSKYQKYFACSYDYKLVPVDDKFSKPFKSYLLLSIVWLKEASTVVKWWKIILTKNLWWLKKTNKDFKNSTKCWICDNIYVDSDIKVRDHCYITGKYEVQHKEIVISMLN